MFLETWEMWWDHYAVHNWLFTLFLLNSKTLATQHREVKVLKTIKLNNSKTVFFRLKCPLQVGVHENGSRLKDVSPVEKWEVRWEYENMPKRLPRLGLQMDLIPDFLHRALVLAEQNQHVTLKLLHSAKDVELALSQPQDELARTLHVASTPDLLGAPLPHLVEEPWPPHPANCSLAPSKDPGFLIHILWTLSLWQVPVFTLPLHLTTPTSFEKIRWRSNLPVAHAYFPATLSTFQQIHGALNISTLKVF